MTATLRLASIGLCALALVLPGCSGKKPVKVSGTLTRGGQPIGASRDTLVTMSFVPEDKAADLPTINAKFNHDTGGFEMEIPPGRYRFKLLMAPNPSSDPKVKRPPITRFEPTDDKFVFEFKSSQEGFNIDLPKEPAK
jgi:hypothetical protein